jgi:hypothetical protein
MKNLANLTLKQLREGLDWLSRNHNAMIDAREYDLANMIDDKIFVYQEAITDRITSEDPFTSRADVRYFEGFRT